MVPMAGFKSHPVLSAQKNGVPLTSAATCKVAWAGAAIPAIPTAVKLDKNKRDFAFFMTVTPVKKRSFAQVPARSIVTLCLNFGSEYPNLKLEIVQSTSGLYSFLLDHNHFFSGEA
jgi:hypothetical protein